VTANSLAGAQAQVAGWGANLSTGGQPVSQLQDATTFIQSPGFCGASYSAFDPTDQLCATNPGGTTGTCDGDSGGPLIVHPAAGPPVEVGIVGFGAGDCDPTVPDFFTAVSAVSPWLSSEIAQTLPPLNLTTALFRQTLRDVLTTALDAPGVTARVRHRRVTCTHGPGALRNCLVSFRAGAQSYVGTVDVHAVRTTGGAVGAAATFALRWFASDCRARPLPVGAIACVSHLRHGRVVVSPR
jgi:Trypsin